jgi:CRP/FNR family transcriptional regulator
MAINKRPDPVIIEILRDVFPQLVEPSLIEEIATEGRILQFPAGEVIMDYGSYIRALPLVLEGTVKVMREDEEDSRELFLYYLGPGQTCAASFSCCLMQKRSIIRTVAEENTKVLALPIHAADRWMSAYQSWRNMVMKTYDERILELVRTIDTVAFRRMDERLLKYLEDRAEATGSRTISTTHQDIANDLNASREAISRLLKQLEREGIIQLYRNKIELRDV